MFLILVINIFHVPTAYFFELQFESYDYFLLIILETVPIYVFIAEILVNFNTACYKKGELISIRKKIAKNYIKSNLTVDFFTIFPFLFGNLFKIRLIQLVLVIRVIKAKKMLNKLEEVFELKGYWNGVFQLFKLIFFIFYIAHLCCCLWYFIGCSELKSGFLLNFKIFEFCFYIQRIC